MKLFTVGHSNHSIDRFIDLLLLHGITAVADVRSYPYSRRLPHFSQASLKQSLTESGIAYVFLGKQLGARPKDPTCYVDGKACYELIAATEAFSEGLERILAGSERHQIALMCAEQDPITCHRTVLVCQHLRDSGLEIQHILKTGTLESHQHLEDRLLKLHALNQLLPAPHVPNEVAQVDGQLQLFDTTFLDNAVEQNASSKTFLNEELIQKAYKLQGDRIAYVEEEHRDREHVHERAS